MRAVEYEPSLFFQRLRLWRLHRVLPLDVHFLQAFPALVLALQRVTLHT